MDYTDLLGTKFTIHGRSKEQGFDCYGLVLEVLKRNGIHGNDVFYNDFKNRKDIREQSHIFNNIKKINEPKLNCIVEMNIRGNPSHVGVYIGDGKFIHSTYNVGVVIEPLYKYKSKIEGYYEVNN